MIIESENQSNREGEASLGSLKEVEASVPRITAKIFRCIFVTAF